MTSRITHVLSALAEQNRCALIPYLMAGDPDRSTTVALMHCLVSAGASAIELGVPFSDPMADGPVIQRAAERALANGVDLFQVIQIVREFRAMNQDTPVILMGYLNPVIALGYDEFAEQASNAGVDGVLIVDLPPEEDPEFEQALKNRDLDRICLLAPTSHSNRIRKLQGTASGFVYYVSLRGVTGASHLDIDEIREKVTSLRQLCGLPVGVGFGINQPQVAAEISRFADVVVIGSAIVQRIEASGSQPGRLLDELATFVGQVRFEMNRASREASVPIRKNGSDNF